MRCKKAEKLLLKSYDDRLTQTEQDVLSGHLKDCRLCQTKRNEYQDILQTLQSKDFPQPQPYFWERLQPKLKESQRPPLELLWKQWGMRAIPCSLALILFAFLSATFLFPPQTAELDQLSSSGILLRDQNPFADTLPLLAEEGVENPNMMLLFTSLEERNDIRR